MIIPNRIYKEGYKKLKYLHKKFLHSYLQAKDKFVTMKLGEAARAGAFDFKSEELNSLVGFVGEMVGWYISMREFRYMRL